MALLTDISTTIKKGMSSLLGGNNPHGGNPLDSNVEFQEMKAEVNRLKLIESTVKPYEKRYKQDPGVLRVDLPISVPEIYNMSRLLSVLRTVHVNLKNEIFRRGLRWKPRFAVKCTKCGKEYQTEPSVEEPFKCDACGHPAFMYPNDQQLIKLERFMVYANKNGQSLEDLCKELEYDMDVIDDMYMILVKEYAILNGRIMGSKVKEMIRGDPEFLRMVGNEKSELGGGKWWVCVVHRNYLKEGEHTQDPEKKQLGRHFENPGPCPICGLPLQEVKYVAVGGSRSMDPEQYYIDGEIIHTSKYSPSRTYGYPPVLSVWKEASTLLNMQHFVNEYFKYMRAPRGILTTVTMNTESAYKKWDQIQENIKRDPHYIPFIAIQDNGDGKQKNVFQWLNFSETLQEMEYGDVRDELRVRVSSLYGVSNIMMGDTKGAGGMGNEGLQIVVSDRAVQWGQEVWNTNVFPELCRQFGIFDYILELRPNIELVEQKKLELELQKVQIAESMWRMGFNVGLDNEGNFKYSGQASPSVPPMHSIMPGGEYPGQPTDDKVITQDHEDGLSHGQNLTGKTPRGSKGNQYV